MSDLAQALLAAAVRRSDAHAAARAALADAFRASSVAICEADAAYVTEIDAIERGHRNGPTQPAAVDGATGSASDVATSEAVAAELDRAGHHRLAYTDVCGLMRGIAGRSAFAVFDPHGVNLDNPYWVQAAAAASMGDTVRGRECVAMVVRAWRAVAARPNPTHEEAQ